jgi:predicted ester cyclase
MSIEANKAIMRRMIEEIWNQGRLEVADELFAPDATSPGLPLPPGPEGVKLVAGMFLSAFPDLHMEIEDIIAEGDRVVGRFTETATHQGDFMGVPATGRPYVFEGITIMRFRREQVVERWTTADFLGLLVQLGAVPAPA